MIASAAKPVQELCCCRMAATFHAGQRYWCSDGFILNDKCHSKLLQISAVSFVSSLCDVRASLRSSCSFALSPVAIFASQDSGNDIGTMVHPVVYLLAAVAVVGWTLFLLAAISMVFYAGVVTASVRLTGGEPALRRAT